MCSLLSPPCRWSLAVLRRRARCAGTPPHLRRVRRDARCRLSTRQRGRPGAPWSCCSAVATLTRRALRSPQRAGASGWPSFSAPAVRTSAPPSPRRRWAPDPTPPPATCGRRRSIARDRCAMSSPGRAGSRSSPCRSGSGTPADCLTGKQARIITIERRTRCGGDPSALVASSLRWPSPGTILGAPTFFEGEHTQSADADRWERITPCVN